MCIEHTVAANPYLSCSPFAQGEAATLQVVATNASAWLPMTAGTAFQLEDAAWTRDKMPSFAKHLLSMPSAEGRSNGTPA